MQSAAIRIATAVAHGRRKAVSITAVLLAGLSVASGAWAADSQQPPPTVPPIKPTNITAVRVTTNMGAFVITLDAERAPLTVQNFLRYVAEGFYTNTLIHRVVGNFVVQGGGYDAATSKLKPTHEYLVNESGNGLQNKRGSVGMARANAAHSANSQFYVNVADNSELDPIPTRWGYAVFGTVTEGMDVVDKIGVVATGSVGAFKSEAPLKPIVIEKVEALAPAASAAPAAPVAPAPPAAPAPTSSPSGGGETPPPQ